MRIYVLDIYILMYVYIITSIKVIRAAEKGRALSMCNCLDETCRRTSQSIDPTRSLFMLFAAPEQRHLDEQLFRDGVAARVGAYIAMHGQSSDTFEGAI